jgi:hypothetical protein
VQTMHDFEPEYHPSGYRQFMNHLAASILFTGVWVIALVLLAVSVGSTGALVGFFVGGFLAAVAGIRMARWLNARHARREYNRAQTRAAKRTV